MDRRMLIELLQNGMRYPVGRHQIWVSRCLEITVRPDQVVEVDEYESYDVHDGSRPKKQAKAVSPGNLFHVGKSLIDLKGGHVTDHPGTGWQSSR